MNLAEFGWNDTFNAAFQPFLERALKPVRIVREERGQYLAVSEQGALTAEVSGKFMHNAAGKSDYPTVGDWVAAEIIAQEPRGIIHAVVARQSSISRKVAGSVTDEQVLAANIDTLFLVMGLDDNYNVRRIERYVAFAYQSRVAPVVILNKADLCEDVEARVEEIEPISPGIKVLAVSAAENAGMDQLGPFLVPGRTVAFIGSSGVGKSSLINRLLKEDRLKTQEVRTDDSQGRHTTTHRELIILPSGAMVIDTPGIRELQLWGDDDALSGSFPDIEKLIRACRFNDCSHASEPGCAVKEALENGDLDPGRYQNYLKMGKELQYLANKQKGSVRKAEKEKWQKIMKDFRYKKRY